MRVIALWLLLFGLWSVPAGVRADSLAPELPPSEPPVDGVFWETLSQPEQTAQKTREMFTAGFVAGYDYALDLVIAALAAPELDYNARQFSEFTANQKFPSRLHTLQLQALLDNFYSVAANRHLPLFVAFTYARQILAGYPEAYSRQYLEDMRRKYPGP
ncbi:MAG: hypothetical protein AB1439_09750 [candidate division FCPU426 bacterium]